MVELKGAKVDLDRKMPTRNITPVHQRTPPGPPTRYWRKTRSTWNGAETTAAANSVGVSSSRTRIQRSSRSGVRTGWWVMSRFRSGCRVIRVEPCNGGVVGHPSPGCRRLAFRPKEHKLNIQCHLCPVSVSPMPCFFPRGHSARAVQRRRGRPPKRGRQEAGISS